MKSTSREQVEMEEPTPFFAKARPPLVLEPSRAHTHREGSTMLPAPSSLQNDIETRSNQAIRSLASRSQSVSSDANNVSMEEVHPAGAGDFALASKHFLKMNVGGAALDLLKAGKVESS